MKKIAIINQRYGLDINGGSELYTRQLAEHLKKIYEIEVLTSCSNDYTTWANHYDEGIEIINGVTVRRFPTKHPRIQQDFGLAEQELFTNPRASKEVFDKWIENLGPCCFDIIDFLKQNKNKYDLFIVVTYLYFLQVKSIPIIGSKAIFIPTAHDEPYMRIRYFERIFKKTKAYVFLTDEEKEFVISRFNIKPKYYDVLGVGVDLPEHVDSSDFRKKYGISGDYIIYVGRVDNGKNCTEMFSYFLEYKKRNTTDLKLVIMGKAIIPIPKNKDIINLGFVSDIDKFNGIKGSKLLLLPSKYESLSISVLESMALSVPVLVNGKCEVLKGHCCKSQGGLYYTNYFEFEGALSLLHNNHNVYDQMSINAKNYISKHYTWDVIIERFKKLIETIF